MKRYICILLVFLCFNQNSMADHASLSFETGAAGAMMTTPGATLPKGKVVLSVSMQFIEFDDISDSALEDFGAADEDVHSIDNLYNLRANLAYGISDDLTAGVSLPYLERNNIRAAHNDMGMGEVEAAGDASGIGDLSLFGQYRFYHDSLHDVALIGGIKTPTGATEEKERAGELFETDHQPGSGSWDPFLGLAYNRSFGRTGFSANVLYTFTGEGTQQAELGNAFNYNLAVSYRLFSTMEAHHHHHEQHEHAGLLPDYIDIALELNGDARGKDEISGIKEENSGGHILYLSPGMRIGFAHNWSLWTSIGIPVINDLNGEQSEPAYRLVGGISTTF